MNDESIQRYELEWVQEQIYDLVNVVRDLESTVEKQQMEITLLTNDLNIIKTEGCYRFVEDKNHKHE